MITKIYKFLIILLILKICSSCVFLPNKNEIINAENFSKEFSKEFIEYFHSHNESERLKYLHDFLLNDKTNVIKLEGFPNKTKGRVCLLCYAITTTLLSFYESQSFENEKLSRKFLRNLCSYGKIDNPFICRQEVKNYFPFIKFILENRKLTAENVCDVILQANYCFKKKAQYKELSIENPILLGSKKYISTSEKNLRILQLSDFHYDPLYIVGSSTKCDTWICCRGPVTPNISETAGKWGGQPCDSPGYTIRILIEDAAKRFSDVDMIYVTGDYVDHFDWFLSRNKTIDSIQFVFNMIKEYFPNTPIYPILGNHDTFPSNMFAPDFIKNENLSSEWLYKNISNIWKHWLPTDALNLFETRGYYTVKIRPNFRIIALNSNVCFNANLWLLYDNFYFRDQLEWLYEVLTEASNNQEKVHILSHVPSNDVHCYRSWTKEFKKIVERFTHVISAQFNGHTHLDEFAVFYASKNSSNALNVAWNGGGATTFPNVYYNYKIYYIDDQTYDVTDSETWTFDLEAANKSPDEPIKWYKEYNFKSYFNVSDLSPNSLDELIRLMKQDDKLLEKYRRVRVKQSAKALKSECDINCKNSIISRISQTEFDDTNL